MNLPGINNIANRLFTSKQLVSVLFLALGIFFSKDAQAEFSPQKQRYLDSLKFELRSEKSDAQKCEILKALAQDGASDEWFTYNKLLKEIAFKQYQNNTLSAKKKNTFKAFYIIALNNEGYYCQSQGQFERAKKIHQEAYQLSKTHSDKSLESNSLNQLAYIYKYQGNLLKSLDYYHAALKIERKMGISDELAYTYNNIGVIHYSLGNNDKALLLFQNALLHQEKINDSLGVVYTLLNIGSINLKNKDFELAEKNLKKAEKILLKINDIRGLSRSYNFLGNLEFEKKNFSEALDYYQKSAALKVENNNLIGYDLALFNISKASFELNKISEAKKYLASSKVLAAKNKNIELLRDIYQLYYKLYKKAKLIPEALLMHENYVKFKDSIISIENKKGVYRSQLDFEYSLKKATDSINFVSQRKNMINNYALKEKFQQEKYQTLKSKSSLQFLLIVITGVFVIIITILLYLYRKRYNSTSVLNLQLKSTVNEVNLLNKEIHHRVKNNLQIISSLLNIQKMEHGTNQEITEIIQQSQNRIETMALIHERLYQTTNNEINLKEYLLQLITFFDTNYSFKEKNIQCEVNLCEVYLNTNQLVPLGLIVNEIITNSIKYAFPSNQIENVLTFTTSIENKTLIVAIRDNGPGMPEEKLNSASASLGLSLIKGLCMQMKASLKMYNENGLVYHITFNLYE